MSFAVLSSQQKVLTNGIGPLNNKPCLCPRPPGQAQLWPELRFELCPSTAGVLEQPHILVYLMALCQDSIQELQ
jgi:hypothetical protein